MPDAAPAGTLVEADRRWMRLALDLATKGRTHPNPRVGAIVVKNDSVIGMGWHTGVGTPHAETAAFADAAARQADTWGATLYVTLEPCSHTSNVDGTPRTPCVVRCLAAGMARVVCAMEDPDVRVAGRGIAELRSAGVSVAVGAEETRARALNVAYVKHRTTGLPYVLHKAAMTLDGKIAATGGDARWITGRRARAYVHRRLRDAADAIVVGVGTILADDPELTTRLPKGNGHNPLRVVMDSRLRTPAGARVARKGTLFLAAAEAATAGFDDRAEALRATGAEVVLLPSRLAEDCSRVDVNAAVRLLADRGALSLLLESGGELAASFWQAGLVDGVTYFVAPKIIGGRDAATPVDGDGVARSMMDAVTVSTLRVRRFGPDIALEGEVKR